MTATAPLSALNSLLTEGGDIPLRRLNELTREARLQLGGRISVRVSRLISGTAFRLYGFLCASPTAQNAAACFEFWLGTGSLGWILASEYVRLNVTPFPELRPFLGKLPAEDSLHLVNRLLTSEKLLPPQAPDWCGEVLASIPALPPETLVSFLADLTYEGHSLSSPVRTALLEGRAVERLDSLLQKNRPRIYGVLGAALSALDVPIRQETLSRSLESAPAQALPRLLKAVGRCGVTRLPSEDGVRAISKLAGHANPQVKSAAAMALLRIAPDTARKIIAYWGSKLAQKGEAYLPALLLPPTDLKQLLESPDNSDGSLTLGLFSALRDAAPDEADAALERLRRSGSVGRNHPELAEAFRLYWENRRNEAVFTFPKLAPRTKTSETNENDRSLLGILGRSTKLKKTEIETALAPTTISGRDLSGANIRGDSLSGKRLTSVTARNMSILSGRCDSAAFSECDLGSSLIQDIVFEGCRFDGCDLSHVEFSGVTFINCLFRKSTLTSVRMKQCRFQGGEVAQCHSEGAILEASTLVDAQFRESCFFGMGLSDLSAERVRIRACDLSHTVFRSCSLSGAEFLDSRLHGMRMDHSRLRGCELENCAVNNCRFHHVECDDPGFRTHHMHGGLDALLRVESPSPLPRPLNLPAAVPFLAKALGLWRVYDDLSKRESAFLAENRRRRKLAAEPLGPARDAFVRALPLLLQSDIFERVTGKPTGCPPHAIDAYTPTLSDVEALRTLFGEGNAEQPPENAPRIEALYSMGSTGSIAMTSKSDLDCWVCLPSHEPSRQDAVSRKLAMISRWAEEELGLESTFFVHSLDAVRTNDFGFSDAESSGSAQAILLKEEFYRTALKIAGRNLAWWLIPPGADARTYAGYLRIIARAPWGLPDRTTDFGHMDPIPATEYFGASLWQMVKAIKSPFKSIMKLGLLEAYITESSAEHPPLCDRLKDSVTSGRHSLKHVDAYALLYTEVRNFYARQWDRDSAGLVDLAFLLKMNEEGAGTSRGSHLEALRNGLLTEIFRDGRPPMQFDRNSLPLLVELGDKVNSFILGVYDRVREQLAGAESTISPEDLTKLGRRLFAVFSRRENKLQRIPFLLPTKGAFTALLFSAEKAPGKKTLWIVSGLPADLPSRREYYAEIRRDTDPVRLMLWLVANGIYSPTQSVSTDRTFSPMSVGDVAGLLRSLHDFFPDKTTFDTPLDEMLKPERVVRAFFVCNLLTDRSNRDLREATLLYSTNWGELFCLRTEPQVERARTAPRRYLNGLVPQAASDEFPLDYFIPEKSRCPKLIVF